MNSFLAEKTEQVEINGSASIPIQVTFGGSTGNRTGPPIFHTLHK